MTFGPHNMREIADKIQGLIHEAEKAAIDPNKEPDRQTLDDLLTNPADAKKLGDEIDKNALTAKLKLTPDESSGLTAAIDNLSKESPVINQENAIAILTAFKKIASKTVAENIIEEDQILTEKYNKNFDDPISYKHVEDALKNASEISPLAKDYALRLAVTLTKGSKGRTLDGGLEGILNAIVYAIDIATQGNRSELLHMLDDFENKYEGDTYAFDQELWNDLMANLKKLAKEALHRG